MLEWLSGRAPRATGSADITATRPQSGSYQVTPTGPRAPALRRPARSTDHQQGTMTDGATGQTRLARLASTYSQWRKRIWRCEQAQCPAGSWRETCDAIAPRASLTQRARAEACRRVGRDGHSVAEVAREFGVGWHDGDACGGRPWHPSGGARRPPGGGARGWARRVKLLEGGSVVADSVRHQLRRPRTRTAAGRGR